MVHELSTQQWLVVAWFAGAVLIEVVGTNVLAVWLRRKGVVMLFGLTGVAGYLEYRYARWCRVNGRTPNTLILLRLFSLVNVVAAFVVAYPIFGGT